MKIFDRIEKDKLLVYDGPDKVVSAADILKKYEGREEIEPWKSKLPSIDECLGGFYPGQLIVISGTTGHGKTTLAQTISQNMIPQYCKPLWLSFEVNEYDFIQQFDRSAYDWIYMPAELTDRKLSWVEDRLIEANLKYNVQSIFIDHLHFLVEMIAKQNISFVVGEVVRGLKEIAKRQNMVAFLICHTGKTREDTGELGLGMVRDSSFIEQEADSVIYVWRGEDEEIEVKGEKRTVSPTWAKIAKNRKRGIINKKVPLYYFRGIYYESAEYQEQYYGRYHRV